jgi:hypothetical protein
MMRGGGGDGDHAHPVAAVQAAEITRPRLTRAAPPAVRAEAWQPATPRAAAAAAAAAARLVVGAALLPPHRSLARVADGAVHPENCGRSLVNTFGQEQLARHTGTSQSTLMGR